MDLRTTPKTRGSGCEHGRFWKALEEWSQLLVVYRLGTFFSLSQRSRGVFSGLGVAIDPGFSHRVYGLDSGTHFT
jgi:hypothetical protein